MKTKLLLIISAIFLAFFINQMQAQEPAKWHNGVYFGFGLDVNASDGYYIDDSSLSIKNPKYNKNSVMFLAGYGFKHFDIELGYKNGLGDFTQTFYETTPAIGDVSNRALHNDINTISFALKPKFKLAEKHTILAIIGADFTEFTTVLDGAIITNYIPDVILEKESFTDFKDKTRSYYVNLGLGYEYRLFQLENEDGDNGSFLLGVSYSYNIAVKTSNSASNIFITNETSKTNNYSNASLYFKIHL